MKRKVLVFVCLAGSVASARATSPANRSVERLYGYADAVVAARVVGISASCRGSAKSCSRSYSIVLDEVHQLKGNVNGKKRLCSNVPVEIGATYTLFLELPSEFNDSGPGKCDLVLDYDGAFEKRGEHTYRVGSPEARIIVDFEGAKFMTDAMVEPSFDDRLKILLGGAAEARP